MSSTDHVATGSTGGRTTLLWGGALVLAAAATVVLILSDDARLLRLGLVAALWAALIGAFAVARLRERISDGERAAAERQRIYELELEREVAARREFVAQAEADARRRAEEDSSAQIRVLQSELANLRETLEQVIGGDVFFERVALRAESTRVRSMPDHREGTVVSQPGTARIATAKAADQPTQQVKPVARVAHPPVSTPQLAAAKSETTQRTEVISQLSGQVPLHETRSRPKTHVTQAFPDRPTPGRPRVRRIQQPVRPEPVPEPADEDSGAHAAGTSVNDLLAAYGATTGQRKRRRRD